MKERLHILLIDDDAEEYLLLKEVFPGNKRGTTQLDYDVDWVSTYEEAVRALSACKYDVYLVNDKLGERSGLDLLREPAFRDCAAPVIILSGQGDHESDLMAMQLGAADSLDRDNLTLPLFERSIRYAIDRKLVEEYLQSVLKERTQVLARLQKQTQELNALQKATTSLLNTLEISSLLAQIMDAAQEAIPSAERVWLHLVEEHNSRLNYGNETNFSDPRIYRMKLPEGSSDALKAIAEGKPVLIADTQAEPRLLSLLDKEEDRAAVRSVIIAPLAVGHQIFGAISLGSSSVSAFTSDALRLLTSFATTASAAIQNAILYAQTQELATTDPLTGRLNRRAFFEWGQRELDRFQRSAHPLSALMFDIDHFKHVNDRHGHSAGDQVLAALADRCCRVIRNVDILGRLGGDEFAVLLPNTDLLTASEVADRIRTSVSESPITTDAGPISISISVGVVQASQDSRDLGDLLNQADQALYQAKEAGRNRTSTLL